MQTQIELNRQSSLLKSFTRITTLVVTSSLSLVLFGCLGNKVELPSCEVSLNASFANNPVIRSTLYEKGYNIRSDAQYGINGRITEFDKQYESFPTYEVSDIPSWNYYVELPVSVDCSIAIDFEKYNQQTEKTEVIGSFEKVESFRISYNSTSRTVNAIGGGTVTRTSYRRTGPDNCNDLIRDFIDQVPRCVEAR